MKKHLIKKGKKSTAFCSLETEGGLLYIKTGKVGKPISSITQNCGTSDEAHEELEKLYSDYKTKGYMESDDIGNIEPVTFDKAKWHFTGDFPTDLDQTQAYVHTGFYIGWLIKNNLISEEFRSECSDDINKFLSGKISSTEIYINQLDGVFSNNEVNEIGAEFTKDYFDFDNGKYLHDYEQILASSVPTIYHVKDTNENFLKISEVIDKRFRDWRLKDN